MSRSIRVQWMYSSWDIQILLTSPDRHSRTTYNNYGLKRLTQPIDYVRDVNRYPYVFCSICSWVSVEPVSQAQFKMHYCDMHLKENIGIHICAKETDTILEMANAVIIKSYQYPNIHNADGSLKAVIVRYCILSECEHWWSSVTVVQPLWPKRQAAMS